MTFGNARYGSLTADWRRRCVAAMAAALFEAPIFLTGYNEDEALLALEEEIVNGGYAPDDDTEELLQDHQVLSALWESAQALVDIRRVRTLMERTGTATLDDTAAAIFNAGD